MHHALRFYSSKQEFVVRFYMFGAKLTKIPVVGRFVKAFINWFATTQHYAYILTPDEAKMILDAVDKIAVGDCKCRKVFRNCDNPIRTDIVIGVGYDIFTERRIR